MCCYTCENPYIDIYSGSSVVECPSFRTIRLTNKNFKQKLPQYSYHNLVAEHPNNIRRQVITEWMSSPASARAQDIHTKNWFWWYFLHCAISFIYFFLFHKPPWDLKKIATEGTTMILSSPGAKHLAQRNRAKAGSWAGHQSLVALLQCSRLLLQHWYKELSDTEMPIPETQHQS